VHEKNLELMYAGVYNAWIEKSLGRLAKVMPGRYAKSEHSDGFMQSVDRYAYRAPNAPDLLAADSPEGAAETVPVATTTPDEPTPPAEMAEPSPTEPVEVAEPTVTEPAQVAEPTPAEPAQVADPTRVAPVEVAEPGTPAEADESTLDEKPVPADTETAAPMPENVEPAPANAADDVVVGQ
jgi:hypothetical protein